MGSMGPAPLQELPQSFRNFCAANKISEDIYLSDQALPRYIRFKTPPSADIIAAVSNQLGTELQPVQWLPGFFTLPQNVKIAGSEAYKKGEIFGIDASSGAAVTALDVQGGDNVLDLCAAPGAKLCLIANQVSPSGTATGVDISPPRLAATRTLLRKYGASHNCRLFLADGTSFDDRPPTRHETNSKRPSQGTGSEREVERGRCSEGSADSGCVNAVREGGETEATHCGTGMGIDAVEDSGACNISRGEGGTAVEPELSSAALTEAERLDSEDRRPAGAECCDVDISPAERGECLDTSKGQASQGGTNRKRSRRRQRLVDGSAEGAHLFFFGRGITPPALENAEGPGRAELYDKVLVDAECTHDGSLKHIRKYDWWGWDTFERRVMDPQRLDALTTLQGRLLRNGFKLLRPGGSLVYSTCSFTKAQNEDVVSAFLEEHPDADLVAIPQAAAWPCSSGALPHTVRFTPDVSKTGGLFIARIVRRVDERVQPTGVS